LGSSNPWRQVSTAAIAATKDALTNICFHVIRWLFFFSFQSALKGRLIGFVGVPGAGLFLFPGFKI